MTHSRTWFIFALASIYFLTTAVVYLLFLGVGRDWNILPEDMMIMSAILRVQSVATIGLIISISAFCVGKSKWIKRR